MAGSKGKERFFWQYNVQAKGPKGKRLVFQSKLEDPHFLNEVTDPVFSPTCSVRGIKVYKVGLPRHNDEEKKKTKTKKKKMMMIKKMLMKNKKKKKKKK